MALTRRELLQQGLLGLTGIAFPACVSDETASPPARPDGGAPDAPDAPDVFVAAAVEPGCADDAVVRSLIDEPTDPFVPLRRWLMAGVDPMALYRATLAAGARVVPPDDDMHGVMGVGAARLLSARVRTEHRLMPLFRTWVDQHQAVGSARRAARPALPDTPPLPRSADAAGTLVRAWEAWDSNAADAAMQTLYDAGGRAAVIAPLALYAQRNHDWVGHRVIWTAHAIRSLDALGWGCARPVLRSLARVYASNRSMASTAAFDANRLRLPSIRRDWGVGADDPGRVPALVAILREGDASACVSAVVSAIASGLGTRTLWTALALSAVELSVRRQESSFGVHELDTLNAFRFLSTMAPDPDTRLLMLLQAAAWRPEFRVLARGPVIFEEPLLSVTPRPGRPPDLTTALASLSGDHIEATHTLAAYFAGGGSTADLIAAWPDIVVARAGSDVHHYKFNCALLEEAEAALPEYRPALLLGITLRGPSPSTPRWSRYDDATAILASLG